MKKHNKILIITYLVFTIITLLFCFVNNAAGIADINEDIGLWRYLHFELNPFNYGVPYKKISLIIASSSIIILLYCFIVKFIEKKKQSNVLSVIISIIFSIAFVCSCLFLCYRWYKQINNIYVIEDDLYKFRNKMLDERYVIHAGGYIWCEKRDKLQSYTNSYEAIQNCYNDGHRVSEVDFILTSDHKYVCSHNGKGKWSNALNVTEKLTEEEFLQEKAFDTFTTMSLDNLADFMYKHPDFYVVTDVKSNPVYTCEYIATNYPDLLDRFIVQIYHIDQYDPIYNMGFKYILFTLYKTDESERTPEALDEVSKNYNLLGFTFWYYYTDDEEFLKTMKNTGTPLYVHTVNEKEELKKYIDLGISGIYTDLTKKDDLYYD